MELKKVQCSNCSAVEEIALLPGQAIYRCKACKKLSKVIAEEQKQEIVEEAPIVEKPKKRKKQKKND